MLDWLVWKMVIKAKFKQWVTCRHTTIDEGINQCRECGRVFKHNNGEDL